MNCSGLRMNCQNMYDVGWTMYDSLIAENTLAIDWRKLTTYASQLQPDVPFKAGRTSSI
jgi:hypothetical protein